jgi:ubiquinone/menaquinone biosynthesis C-methylase UbiE
MPRRMKTPVPFVMNEVPRFKRNKIKHILDLGCGMGRPCVHLAEKGFEVVGIDISESALRMANTWAHREKLANVALICGAMAHLPFRDDCFDAVVSISAIIHAVKKNIEKTVAEIHRTLRKNGLLLTNLTSTKDPRYGKGEKIEGNTFKILEAFEDKRFEETHHFFTKKEAQEMFSRFTDSKVTLIKEEPYYWKVLAIK